MTFQICNTGKLLAVLVSISLQAELNQQTTYAIQLMSFERDRIER